MSSLLIKMYNQFAINIHNFIYPLYTTKQIVERYRTDKKLPKNWDTNLKYKSIAITYQDLVEITYRNGKPWKKKLLDREIIPESVMITLGCFGDTGGWRSRFYKLIG